MGLPLVGGWSVPAAQAMDLKEAIAVAMTSNPQILQAVQNREATEFELRQARGLILPSIDLEGSVGVQRLDSPDRRRLGDEGDDLYPSQVGLSITQPLFDGGNTRAQVEQQAARVDGASFRVLQRQEAIALEVAQEYLEYLVQQRVVEEAQRNVGVHRQILGDIGQGVSGGTLTAADRLQAQERLSAAQARLKEATEDLNAANIRFNRLVGQPITAPKMPRSVAASLPPSLDKAIALARINNPRIFAAEADIDASDAMVRQTRANYMPNVSLEGSARVGNNINANEGKTNDLSARVVARWNLYRGGRDVANEQEKIRRASEQRMVLHQVSREVEESVRSSWDRRQKRAELAKTLSSQAETNARLVSSYREQFNVGQRSLLDVLDAQNTRFNVSVLADTARFAAIFADYRLLAATGNLLRTMQVTPAPQGVAYARNEFLVQSQTDEPDYTRLPSRQEADLPLDLLAPVRK
jgi:adhesin transport system outer membrane protein